MSMTIRVLKKELAKMRSNKIKNPSSPLIEKKYIFDPIRIIFIFIFIFPLGGTTDFGGRL
jgi:hypothetical protein